MTARILIVDDVPANTSLLEAKLGAEYYQVATAQDGRAALALADEWQPDLILLDVMMPEMDGFETCRRLKENPRTLHIPVVMVTALSDPQERLHGLEVGADDFLTKPVDYDTLLARLKSLIRLKRLLDEWRVRGETARALGLTGESYGPPSVAGARALVVDDWDSSAQALQDILAREGILTGRASRESEALQLTAAMPFDLVVLSLSMAGEDALRLASRLRAADGTHDIPMLLIAEPEQKSRILRGFDLGANDWLLRPVDENELRARARNQIRRKFYQDRLRADLGHALEMALTDPLTGFYNQRYLMRHLGSLIAAGQPNGIAVMMIDVDHFKEINDRWGHQTGDEALRAIADTLRRRIRVFDSIARYGGEEFVVVMPGTGAQEAYIAAERLREAIVETVFSPEPGLAHPITVSIGVACSHGTPTTAERLLHLADQALYEAKRCGRNRTEESGAGRPRMPALGHHAERIAE
ncbi:MAG: PleD family two-component system response regulator [Rhodospirillales bacterium]|nr:PleD family two-component system response regulator [Rhodospirillales bacterium]MDE2198520.1 PleD family two-component system response regulator [Rhodospirillales bacterium]MDE2576573.1 PleD family two-component system response regulator [Rhodospirillales bacterium]